MGALLTPWEVALIRSVDMALMRLPIPTAPPAGSASADAKFESFFRDAPEV